ncbi:MAG: hypothetical protein IPG04_36315 [Polyangiaceae bacterium]|nr:hypothetical protein [Polyangiaceae bacterium]
MEREGRREPALASAGLSPAEWATSQRKHLAALRASLEGDGELARRYLEAYGLALAASAEPPPRAAAPSVLARLGATPSVARPASMSPPVSDADLTLPPTPRSDATLPFHSPAAPVRPPPAHELELPDASGHTLAASESPLADLPFDDSAAEIRLLNLDRYAALAAQLRTAPANAEQILTAHGLTTPEQRQRVHALWKLRFEANPALREKFDRLVEEGCAVSPGAGPP